MIAIIESKDYDQEAIHCEYESLIERYIKERNYGDPELELLMDTLIDLPKDFWYA